jgi:hypothetical protein
MMNNLKQPLPFFFGHNRLLGCTWDLCCPLIKQQFLLEQVDRNRFESYLVADELKESSED